MRKSGVLLHISSLPSPYGIGTFGKEAYEFVDFLKKANQSYWQILPLGPTSYGDSPYQTFSAFALNPYFVDLDMLVLEKLLTKNEIIVSSGNKSKVNYEKIYQERFVILRKAYQRFSIHNDDFQKFISSANWLHDYALFMTIKGLFDNQSWMSWDENLRVRDKDAIKEIEEKYFDEIHFYKFIQYFANKQWFKLKAYANNNGIEIIGDMPIYVSFDSSDVWSLPHLFQLDNELKPSFVAGVPPDNYSEDGQLWGNPLYNWEELEKVNYYWWVNRVKDASNVFDYTRIDHFIGFENYFSIPYGDATAKNGKWLKGPGIKLFNKIREELGDVKIIAEDLGVVTDEVRALLSKTNFPGMKLLQFAFDKNETSDHAPHLYHENVVCYTGTHDNFTTKQWVENLDDDTLKQVFYYTNHPYKKGLVFALIKEAYKSVAKMVVIPMQDILELGGSARMNIPSTLGNNWTWRMKKEQLSSEIIDRLNELSRVFHRNNIVNETSEK